MPADGPLIIDNLSRLRQICNIGRAFNPFAQYPYFRLGMHYALEPSIALLASIVAMLRLIYTCCQYKSGEANLTRALAAGHIDVAFTSPCQLNRRFCTKKKLLIDEFGDWWKSAHRLGVRANAAKSICAKQLCV